jgi:hypothetical protein
MELSETQRDEDVPVKPILDFGLTSKNTKDRPLYCKSRQPVCSELCNVGGTGDCIEYVNISVPTKDNSLAVTTKFKLMSVPGGIFIDTLDWDLQNDCRDAESPTFDDMLLDVNPNPSPNTVTLEDPEVAESKYLSTLTAELSKKAFSNNIASENTAGATYAI